MPAIELIEERRKKDAEKHIKSFDEDPEMQILNGRWGPYIKAGKKNVRIPKNVEVSKLSYEECVNLLKRRLQKRLSKEEKIIILNSMKFGKLRIVRGFFMFGPS